MPTKRLSLSLFLLSFFFFYSFVSPVPSFQAFSLSSLLFPAFSGEIYLFRDSLRRLEIRIVGKKWNSKKLFCRDISSIRIVIKWGTKMKIIVYIGIIKINMIICMYNNGISLMKSEIKEKNDGNISSVINYNIFRCNEYNNIRFNSF